MRLRNSKTILPHLLNFPTSYLLFCDWIKHIFKFLWYSIFRYYTTLRSFIAIELPEAVKAALSECQQELQKCGADVRWAKPGSIHLTLKFLGDIEDKAVDAITKALEGTCKKYSTFTVEVRGTGVFPNNRSPRVLWAGIYGNDLLTDLQKEIEDGMALLGFKKEDRSFSPHLTLGRIRSLAGKEALVEKLGLLKDRTFGEIAVTSVALIKSELTPAGAKYTRIAAGVLDR